MNIGLVGCSQTKHFGTYPAKNLYSSTLFKFAFAHAMQYCDQVFILSAKYGLLHPETHIQHYDMTLDDMGVAQRVAWGDKTFQQIEDAVSTRDHLYFFCGRLYRDALPENGLARFVCHVPLNGMPIGKQLQWYKQNTSV